MRTSKSKIKEVFYCLGFGVLSVQSLLKSIDFPYSLPLCLVALLPLAFGIPSIFFSSVPCSSVHLFNLP